MKTELICVFGVVQGVGFRPFVSRLAAKHNLRGTVCNKGSYVEIAVQGLDEAVEAFCRDLPKLAPERSAILKIDQSTVDRDVFASFEIVESAREEGHIFVSPDIAICDACKAELFDKSNRRYLHPFINCTACGPRLTQHGRVSHVSDLRVRVYPRRDAAVRRPAGVLQRLWP